MNPKSTRNNGGAASTSENNETNDIDGRKQRSTGPIVYDDNVMLNDPLEVTADSIEVVMKSECIEQDLADENSRMNNETAAVTYREQIDVDLSS